jgi:hypothetical protein
LFLQEVGPGQSDVLLDDMVDRGGEQSVDEDRLVLDAALELMPSIRLERAAVEGRADNRRGSSAT